VAEILWEENFGVSKGPEENKKTATAFCKLCTRTCTSKFSKVWGEPRMQRPLYCLLLLAGFFWLSELTGPDGLAKENRPNCPALKDFEFLFLPSFGSYQPKKFSKLC
jgi:hypothetical protein